MNPPPLTSGASVPATPSGTALTRWRLAAIAVVLATAALMLHRLGAAEVCGANEAIEGVFVQQMVEHGVLLFPLENGSAPMYKPPLFHWTAAALDRDRPRQQGDRVQSAAAVGALRDCGSGAHDRVRMGAARRGRRDTRGADSGRLVPVRERRARRPGRYDAVLFRDARDDELSVDAARDAASACSCCLQLHEPTAREVALRYLFALALGLGVLAKGPVAIILPLGAIVVFLLRERRLGELRDLFTPGSLFVAIVVSLGWYVACAMGRRYGFLGRQLESENFGRFFGALGFMAPWYYLKPILLNSVPLSLIVPFAAAAALRRPADAARAASSVEARQQRARFDARMLATFWLLTVIFFTVAAYKRRAYLLPLWPSSAFLLAWGADELAQRSRWGRVARARWPRSAPG